MSRLDAVAVVAAGLDPLERTRLAAMLTRDAGAAGLIEIIRSALQRTDESLSPTEADAVYTAGPVVDPRAR